MSSFPGGRWWALSLALVCAALLPAVAVARAAPSGYTVVLSADTEGHVGACRSCPGHAGFGGLDRRATAVNALRQREGGALLVDAGNALFGGESMASGGKVIVAAYAALGYAAVNISHRDFRLGKRATLDLLKGARFAPVSANLLDADSGELLFRPWVVRESAGRKVALLGVTEPPAGLNALPHLRRQLAGIRIAPPDQALAHSIPKARAESDGVVVLYYGTASGARTLREKAGKDVDAILVGGARPEQLPAGGMPPLVATDEHGKFVARVRMAGPGKADVAQVPIEPTAVPDPAMVALLATFAP